MACGVDFMPVTPAPMAPLTERPPLVEFVAADDYEQARELLAVIRGSDGGATRP